MAQDVGRRRERGTALSHKHNAQRVQSLQNIKIPPAVLSCNIHVDTIETTMSRFSRVFMSGLAVKGLGPGRGRGFHTSPGCCIPGKVTQIFNPSALHQGSRG